MPRRGWAHLRRRAHPALLLVVEGLDRRAHLLFVEVLGRVRVRVRGRGGVRFRGRGTGRGRVRVRVRVLVEVLLVAVVVQHVEERGLSLGRG